MCLLLWLCASQGRVNASAFPMAPLVSFQPLSSCLAHHGFNQQCAQHEQQYNWRSQQDSQRAEELEAALDGGSQWPPHGTWLRVAVILSVQAPVDDWEAVGGSRGSTEQA